MVLYGPAMYFNTFYLFPQRYPAKIPYRIWIQVRDKRTLSHITKCLTNDCNSPRCLDASCKINRLKPCMPAVMSHFMIFFPFLLIIKVFTKPDLNILLATGSLENRCTVWVIIIVYA